MKPKLLIQVLVVFMLMFVSMGGSQSALASTNSIAAQADAMVIDRDLDIWNATYIGFVTADVFENWHFDFTTTHTFVVTVSPVTSLGGLVPLLILKDSNGVEITHGTNSVTSTQGAGSYSIQVQPEAGGGVYFLTLREVVQTLPSASLAVDPSSINVGESALVTVSLNNVPAEGYASAEFTCTYDASVIEVSNIAVTSLFGADPAVAINGPQNGSFIVAIAGSNGNKATSSGPAFTFSALGLQAGQTSINCTVRVSTGDGVLTQISSTGTTLTVTGSAPTASFTPTPAESATPTSSTPVGSPTATSSTPVGSPTATSSTPVGSPTATSSTPVGSPTATSSTPVGSPTATSSTPVGSPTATSMTPVGTATASSTPVESATPTFTSTPIESPTPTSTFTPIPPTSTPLPNGTLTGQVLAGKPVTVSLYDADNALIASATANPDGTFSLTAAGGSYRIRATASGFLSAEGMATIPPGGSSSMPTIALLAGDIDNNEVINQLDALTIGMNYNLSTPTAADLNNDGTINVLDLELLARNYRMTGPIAWQVSYPYP